MIFSFKMMEEEFDLNAFDGLSEAEGQTSYNE
jgi:hypothetical protein